MPQRSVLPTRHAMWRAIAGSDPGRSMKWFRFSLKARKPRGERTRASRRMRRNGTLGTSITAASRISCPCNSSRQRRRFSAKGRLTRYRIHLRVGSSGGKSETTQRGNSG